MFRLAADMPVPTFKTDEERREYGAGRAAKRSGLDYFDNPHMNDNGPIMLKTAWAFGWLSDETPAEHCASVAANKA